MLDRLFKHLDDQVERRRDEQVAFLQRLVRARSANPFTPEISDPGQPIERDVAHLLADRLHGMGLSPVLSGVSDARPNVVALWPANGAGEARSLILNGHMDTVMPGPSWTRDPFGAAIDGGRLYGLGALDMKASLSMCLFAVQALIDAGVQPGGTLALAFVVDEEPGAYSPFGSAYLLEHDLASFTNGTAAALVAEPMNDNVTIGHRGGYRFRLVVRGEATHTGLLAWERGERGHNAITGMARAIMALDGLALPYAVTPAFPGRKPVFTFPTLIQGGVSINAVPDQCVAYGDVRLLPGCDAAAVEAAIRARLDAVGDLVYTLERLLFVPAVEIPPDHDLVESLARQTQAVTGRTPTRLGCGPWNDGWMFITRGIPAICGFGPNGAGVHGPDEYVEVDSLIETTRVVARAIVDFLGMV